MEEEGLVEELTVAPFCLAFHLMIDQSFDKEQRELCSEMPGQLEHSTFVEVACNH